MSRYMEIIAEELLAITKGCRDDMHEPDEQELELGGICGTKLDNAFGSDVRERAVLDGYQEVVFSLRRTHYDKSGEYDSEKLTKFNLATVIALARIGAAKLLEEKP